MIKRMVSAWLLCGVLAVPGLAAPVDGGLFAPVPTKAAASSGEPGRVRGRAVSVDFDLFADSAAKAGQRAELPLNLFPDAAYTAVLDQVVFETRENLSWVGHLKDLPGSHVALVAGGGVLVGNVALPDGTSYRIRYTPARVHVVEQVDASAFPPGAQAIPVFPEDVPDSPASKAVGKEDDGTVFDLMVVYTPAARKGAGGHRGIKNLITLGVTETNRAYANSGVIPRLRLVHVSEIAYKESADALTDLNRLRTPRDRHLDRVQKLRDTHGADLVSLVVQGGDTSICGIAYIMHAGGFPGFESRAYSYVQRACISPNYSFGHELGHNLGCQHAPDDTESVGAFSFSYGYKDPASRLRTIMAYACTPVCPRVLQFSSSEATFNGLATGTASQDNARSINQVRSIVANFRPSRARARR